MKTIYRNSIYFLKMIYLSSCTRLILDPSGNADLTSEDISCSEMSSPIPFILEVDMSTHYKQNSKSSNERLYISLKSNKSNRTIEVRLILREIQRILSSALESEKMMTPANNSKASINPIKYLWFLM
jgi:hypothetical protein